MNILREQRDKFNNEANMLMGKYRQINDELLQIKEERIT